MNFINSSLKTNALLADCQKKLNPNRHPLKLLADVKTCWWSTHTMITRAINLKPALDLMFHNIAVAHQRNCRQGKSKLQKLALTSDQFTVLSLLEEVLQPFAEAQRCLEGDHYVTISLIVIVVKRLHDAVHAMLTTCNNHPQLSTLVQDLHHDFVECWGDQLFYSSYWAALLDPRTKTPMLSVLTDQETRQIWADICDAIMELLQQQQQQPIPDHAMGITEDSTDSPPSPLQKRRKGAASFLMCGTDSVTHSMNPPTVQVISLEAEVSLEISVYEVDAGCRLHDEDNNFCCPLDWWKVNHVKYPRIWLLAKRILDIPATSAPSERVFSMASNIIDKKRARLSPGNAEILMFLRGNKSLVNWNT